MFQFTWLKLAGSTLLVTCASCNSSQDGGQAVKTQSAQSGEAHGFPFGSLTKEHSKPDAFLHIWHGVWRVVF